MLRQWRSPCHQKILNLPAARVMVKYWFEICRLSWQRARSRTGESHTGILRLENGSIWDQAKKARGQRGQ